MTYEAPGRVEELSDDLRARWNFEIFRAYEALQDLQTRFFEIDPGALKQPRVTSGVAWPADPFGPTFCADDGRVRALCDWAARGRQMLHNEYCEYAVLEGEDATGRPRPKRVQVTTELREYWLTLATYDPEQVLAAAADVLGSEPGWSELYGVSNPRALDEGDRRRCFATEMAGHGNDPELEAAGVPRNPRRGLNTENAVFMTHPINGLDDLLYILLFGARRFVVPGPDGAPRRAGKDEVFAAAGLPQLACRHADPTTAMAAYEAVLADRALSVANPLGVYLRPFNRHLLQVDGAPIDEGWVRWSRGKDGLYQRLELGPSDEDDAFLDDIEVAVGAERQPLTGGYQLLKILEVGPLIATGEAEPASETEFAEVPAADPIECRSTGICKKVIELEAERSRV